MIDKSLKVVELNALSSTINPPVERIPGLRGGICSFLS